MGDHSPECQDQFRRAQEARQAWAQAWPHYCRSCNGYGGGWSAYDPSPSGVSLAPGSVVDFDPCSTRSDASRCARCFHQHGEEWLDGDLPCAACGWSTTTPQGMPPEAECVCWPATVSARGFACAVLPRRKYSTRQRAMLPPSFVWGGLTVAILKAAGPEARAELRSLLDRAEASSVNEGGP
jgi:hypothetical protein